MYLQHPNQTLYQDPPSSSRPLTRVLKYRQEGDTRRDLLHDLPDLPLNLLLSLLLPLPNLPSFPSIRFSTRISTSILVVGVDVELPSFEGFIGLD